MTPLAFGAQLTPRLGAAQLARLRELAETATRSAATSLGAMIDARTSIAAVNVRRVTFAEAQGLMGDPEQPVAAAYLVFEGGLAGQIALVLQRQAALRLVDMLMFQEAGTATEFDDLAASALGEVGNQTGSAFLNTLADSLGLQVRISPPAVVVDMAAAVLNSVVAQASAVSDEIVALDTPFAIEDEETEALFLVIPDPGSLELMAGGLA